MLAFLTKNPPKNQQQQQKKNNQPTKKNPTLTVFREGELLYIEQNKLIFWYTLFNVTGI